MSDLTFPESRYRFSRSRTRCEEREHADACVGLDCCRWDRPAVVVPLSKTHVGPVDDGRDGRAWALLFRLTVSRRADFRGLVITGATGFLECGLVGI